MRLWRVVVLVNVALGLGVGLGYVRWARRLPALEEELARVREAAARWPAGARRWTVRGIVRLPLPDQGGVFFTHEAVPGLMQAMTMGFEAASPALLAGLAPGDPVRFTLEERGARVVVVAIEKAP